MKISQREMVLGVVTFASLLAGGTGYFIDTKTDDWRAKKTEIIRLEQQIRLDKKRIKIQGSWITELSTLQQDLRVFETSQRSVSPELMKTIKTISRKHQLDITRSQPHTEKPTDDLFELGINCTWEGSLKAVVGFLTALQKQGVRYDVRTLNITPAGRNAGKLKGNMLINCAYTRKDKGAK